MVTLAGLSVLFFHYGSYWSSTWSSKWSLLLAFFALVVSVRAGQKASWFLFPVIFYCLISAWSVGIWPANLYVSIADPISLMALEKNSMYAFITIIASVWFLTDVTLKDAKLLLAGMWIILMLERVFILKGQGSYLIGNASMDGCLIAALAPFFWSILPDIHDLGDWLIIPFWFMSWFAVYKTDASAPVAVLFVSTLCYMLSRFRASWINMACWAIPFGAVLAAAGELSVHHQPFIHDSGRFAIWRLSYDWWRAHANIWFGTGFGTAQVLIPLLQAANDPKQTTMFLWLHNEWLQILFEGGIVGVLCALMAWGYFLLRSFKRPELFASFCAFSVMACFNYPLRLAVHCFCLLLVCCLINRIPVVHSR